MEVAIYRAFETVISCPFFEKSSLPFASLALPESSATLHSLARHPNEIPFPSIDIGAEGVPRLLGVIVLEIPNSLSSE